MKETLDGYFTFLKKYSENGLVKFGNKKRQMSKMDLFLIQNKALINHVSSSSLVFVD